MRGQKGINSWFIGTNSGQKPAKGGLLGPYRAYMGAAGEGPLGPIKNHHGAIGDHREHKGSIGRQRKLNTKSLCVCL